MNVIDAIKTRQSIRAYQDKAVDKELIEQVLEAGRLAPSARNQQAWQFICVNQKENMTEVSKCCNNQPCTLTAPMYIVVCATQDGLMQCNQSKATVDCSIALSFMMLRATELGLGTVWLGAFDADGVKKTLNLPDNYIPVAVTPLGYPAEEGRNTSRKQLEEIVTYM